MKIRFPSFQTLLPTQGQFQHTSSRLLHIMFKYKKVRLGETEAISDNADHVIPLLDDDMKNFEGEQTGRKVERWAAILRCPSTFLCLSFGFFMLSGMFYSTRYYLAVTDASCQRRMWPYSMCYTCYHSQPN